MIFNTSDGKELYYKTYGDKNDPCIILIHGIGADHRMFVPQIDFLTDEGYFVITPDMRGHGNSSRVDNLELTDWTRDIDQLITDLKISKFIILGVSMGGVISLKYITEYPQKIKKCIICDSFGEIETFNEKILGFSQLIGFKTFKYLPKEFSSYLFSLTYRNISEEAAEYFKEVSKKADYDQLVLARKAIDRIDVLNNLKSIKIPALVMVGDKMDFMVEKNKKIANSFQNAEFKIIKDGLDPSNLVKPEIFNRLLGDFLKNRKSS